MGNKKSTAAKVETAGDKDVTIIANQELHTIYHDEHEIKLWLILIIVLIQLLLVFYKLLQRRERRRAFKSRRNLDNIADTA